MKEKAFQKVYYPHTHHNQQAAEKYQIELGNCLIYFYCKKLFIP